MTLLCLLCAALAAWWAVPPPAAGPPGRFGARPPAYADGEDPDTSLGSAAGGPPPGVRSGRWRWLTAAGVAGSFGLVGLAALLGGGLGAVLAVTGAVLGWTVGGLVRQRVRGRLVRRRRAEVAHACAALAAQLRVGQVPSVALVAAAADHPVLRRARAVQDLGGDVVRVWRAQAGEPGSAGLLALARGWQVSSRTGAPMATTLEGVAAALVAEQGLRATVAGELSAPRATGKVMAVLPACGVGIGYLLGGEPLGWLLGGPLGWGCLIGGVVLACLGVLWIESLASRAAE